MLRIISCFLLLVWIGTASGQRIKTLLDSSERLEVKGDQGNLVHLYNQIAWEYRDQRPDSSLYFTNRAYKIAEQIGDVHAMIQSTNYMGIAYRNLDVYSKAFEKYLEALRLSEEHQNEEQRGYSLINLGNLYVIQTNYQGAIGYFIQALDQAMKLGNRRMQAYCYHNLGRSYSGIENYDQSELYFTQSIEVRKELEDEYGMIAAELDLADVYRKKGNNSKALTYLEEIVRRVDVETMPRSLTQAYNSLSKVHLAMGNLVNARNNAQKALDLSKSINARIDEAATFKSLSDIYAYQGDFRHAFDYHTSYSALNQQLFSEENIRKIEQLKNQYEIEQKEAENEFLRKQDELNKEIISRQQTLIILIAVGIALALTVALLIYRAYLMKKRYSVQIKSQKDQIESDKTTIEHQSAKLKELDEAKSRFFSNVSHDLRSPLSLILGNMDMVGEDEDSYLSPKAKKNLEVAYKNSKRLLYLTDEINDITRLEEGKINLKRELVNVNSYMKMLSDMFVSTAEYKGVKLNYISSLKDNEAFRIDPTQYEKIFYNLISNAIRHTHKGDQISIKAYTLSDYLYLSFKDTGEGINADSLPFIFDRFFQSKTNEYRSREGMGVGLALVKDLVELHDGSISVESTDGVGTEFLIVMGREDEKVKTGVDSGTYIKEQQALFRDLDTEPKAKLSLDLNQNKADRPTILIVDDHPEIRYYIREILEDQYFILEAAHGIEAMFLLKEQSIDLIITDLMMPFMDGFELIDNINKNEEFSKIPLFVVSARISGADKDKVLYQGVNDYLQKPFERKELTQRIENILNQREKLKDENDHSFKNIAEKHLVDVEQDILMKLEAVVKEKIADSNLSVLDLADAIAASERQVYRLVKRITDMTPHEYIAEVRLQYADFLIRKNKVKNATEVAKSIGMKNVTTFSRQYKKKFGVSPSEILST